MIKKMLIMSAISFVIFANEDIKWNFIKHQLINKPHNEALSLTKTALTAAAGLGVYCVSSKYLPMPQNVYYRTQAKFAASASLGILTSILFYKHDVRLAEIAALKDLLDNWSVYKKQCPDDIVKFIETIKELRTLPDFDEKSVMFVGTINDQINRHFNPASTGSWFNFNTKHFITNLSADLGSTLRGIADIIASLKKK